MIKILALVLAVFVAGLVGYAAGLKSMEGECWMSMENVPFIPGETK